MAATEVVPMDMAVTEGPPIDMVATEAPSMDMTVAVQGLVNLFLNMDCESRGLFIKLLVIKIEEEEVDLLLQVLDLRNQSHKNINNIIVKEDDVQDIKTEPDQYDNDSIFTNNCKIEADNDQHTEDKEIDFKCSYCDESFFTKKDLKKHKETHSEHKEIKVKKTYICDQCPKTYRSSSEMQRHKNIHDGIKPFLCDLCPHRSLHQSHLQRHKRACHTENILKTFICDICSKSFKTNEYLKVHIYREHTRNKVFNCDQCSYETVHVTSLKNHKKKHTGERPFVCDMCSKMFQTNAHLNRHIKGVHLKDKSIYKYDCEHCEHKATNNANLMQHVASVHESVQQHDCKECDYTTNIKRSFTRHMTGHRKVQEPQNQTDYSTTQHFGMASNSLEKNDG